MLLGQFPCFSCPGESQESVWCRGGKEWFPPDNSEALPAANGILIITNIDYMYTFYGNYSNCKKTSYLYMFEDGCAHRLLQTPLLDIQIHTHSTLFSSIYLFSGNNFTLYLFIDNNHLFVYALKTVIYQFYIVFLLCVFDMNVGLFFCVQRAPPHQSGDSTLPRSDPNLSGARQR